MSVENGFVQPEEPVPSSGWASSSSVPSALIFAYRVYCELNWIAVALTVIAGHATLPHSLHGAVCPEVFLPLHFIMPRAKCLLPVSLLASAADKQCSVWAAGVISTHRSFGISLLSEEMDVHPLPPSPSRHPVLRDLHPHSASPSRPHSVLVRLPRGFLAMDSLGVLSLLVMLTSPLLACGSVVLLACGSVVSIS